MLKSPRRINFPRRLQYSSRKSRYLLVKFESVSLFLLLGRGLYKQTKKMNMLRSSGSNLNEFKLGTEKGK